MTGMRGYVAVGHGTEPNGVFDPGAVAPDGTREYDLAFRVVQEVGVLLSQAGVDFYTESAGGPGHDPDYRGSVAALSRESYSWALEVHFDDAAAPRGGMGLWLQGGTQDWVERIKLHYQDVALPFRGNVQRPGLYFLNSAPCPSIIWECDRVGGDVTEDEVSKYAQAIARGTLDWVRDKFQWQPGSGTGSGTTTTTGEDEVNMQERYKFIQANGVHGGWQFQRDGGVFSTGDAPAFPDQYWVMDEQGNFYDFPYEENGWTVHAFPGLASTDKIAGQYFTDAGLGSNPGPKKG